MARLDTPTFVASVGNTTFFIKSFKESPPPLIDCKALQTQQQVTATELRIDRGKNYTIRERSIQVHHAVHPQTLFMKYKVHKLMRFSTASRHATIKTAV